MNAYAVVINIGLPLALLAIAMIIGSILENRHFKSISIRELEFRGLPALTGKQLPIGKTVETARLVSGHAVVSVDYFKRFLAALRMVFGGELRSYASLLDRARREALLRMKQESPEADLIINVRIETSSVSKGEGNALGCTEVLAYGTAITFAKNHSVPVV